MNRVVHFEIHADDIERAVAFYSEVFGWKIEKWQGEFDYWMVMTAEEGSTEQGINGGLVKRPENMPPPGCGANSFVCTVQVEDFDEIGEKILQAGGKVALAKYPLVGMAWQGYFIDTEGNTFGIHQVDEEAK